jgi:hypothetical protein
MGATVRRLIAVFQYRASMLWHLLPMSRSRPPGLLEQITADYRNRILHGGPGSTIRTGFGSYTVYADFHSIWRSDAKPWKDWGVYWFCNRCWQPATFAHGKPECHTCSDWGSCGRDCTLSEVSCQACGTAMAV